MLAVLTEPNANIPALLKTAAANVNTILANSGVPGKPHLVRTPHVDRQPSAGRAATSPPPRPASPANRS